MHSSPDNTCNARRRVQRRAGGNGERRARGAPYRKLGQDCAAWTTSTDYLPAAGRYDAMTYRRCGRAA